MLLVFVMLLLSVMNVVVVSWFITNDHVKDYCGGCFWPSQPYYYWFCLGSLPSLAKRLFIILKQERIKKNTILGK